jgi:hypothetical protein
MLLETLKRRFLMLIFDELVKSQKAKFPVIPAKAGIQGSR